jgi:uncharacterized protein YceK
MTRAALALAALVTLSGCGSLLCPHGYEYVSNGSTYGFAKCEKETD